MIKNKSFKTLALISLIGASISNAVYANEFELNTLPLDYKIVEPKADVNYADMIPDGELENLVNQVDIYHQSNPNLSQEELNEYFKLLIIKNYEELDEHINQSNNYNIDSRGAANYLPIASSSLTAPEKKVFNSNPLKGAKALLLAKQANYHTDSTFNKGKYGYTSTNADAFRHTFWNALMAQSPGVGPTYAKQIADAHEQGYAAKYPKIDSDMDYANNASGRAIGMKGYSGSEAYITNAIRTNVLNAMKQGSLKRYKGDDIGVKTVLVKTNSNGLK